MATETHRLTDLERANLVAYLDGELNEAEARDLGTKITQSVTARREIDSLKKAWDLLDFLPRPEPPDDFPGRTATLAFQQAPDRGAWLASVGGRFGPVVARGADVAWGRRRNRGPRLRPDAVGLARPVGPAGPRPAHRRAPGRVPRGRIDRVSQAPGQLAALQRGRRMNRSTALVIALMLAAAALLTSRAQAGGDEGNLARVQAMSHVDRARISKALETFDGLERSNRDAIRELDNRLAELDPESRARYLAVLRRYHIFYQALSKEKRDALDRETDSAKKLNLIAAYRDEQKNQPVLMRILADGIQVSTLSPLRLRWVARHLIVYFSLDPVKDAKERAEFAKSKTHQEREALISKLMPAKSRGERRPGTSRETSRGKGGIRRGRGSRAQESGPGEAPAPGTRRSRPQEPRPRKANGPRKSRLREGRELIEAEFRREGGRPVRKAARGTHPEARRAAGHPRA